jgi:crotonobetainyl-CoA:carnitine CoA-transferase CaiB-like acyl-CoA transferase
MALVSGVGVPAGAVFDTMELQQDPTFDGKPARLTPSPLLGEHSAEVLNDWLGIGAGDIAALKSEGVL